MAGLLLWARQPGYIDRIDSGGHRRNTALSSKCEQYRVYT